MEKPNLEVEIPEWIKVIEEMLKKKEDDFQKNL